LSATVLTSSIESHMWMPDLNPFSLKTPFVRATP